MDVLALYRAERRESYGLLWQRLAETEREDAATPPRPASARQALNPPTAPIQVHSPGPDGMVKLLNGSTRAGSTPEGLQFWLGV